MVERLKASLLYRHLHMPSEKTKRLQNYEGEISATSCFCHYSPFAHLTILCINNVPTHMFGNSTPKPDHDTPSSSHHTICLGRRLDQRKPKGKESLRGRRKEKYNVRHTLYPFQSFYHLPPYLPIQ